MSQRTHKSARARVAAVVAAPVLSLSLLAPTAAAATVVNERPAAPASVSSHKMAGNPIKGICGPHPTYGGFFCDLNDIAGLLSGVLNAVFKLTCLNEQSNFIICRVNTDNTPYKG